MVSKSHWVPDSSVSSCTQCDIPFTLVQRRHHCRFCGEIFCSTCSSSKVTIHIDEDHEKPVRMCDLCSRLVEYLSTLNRISKDFPSNSSPNSQGSLSNNSSGSIGGSSSSSSISSSNGSKKSSKSKQKINHSPSENNESPINRVSKCVEQLNQLLSSDKRCRRLLVEFGTRDLTLLAGLEDPTLQQKALSIFLNLSNDQVCLESLIQQNFFITRIQNSMISPKESIHSLVFQILQNISKSEKGTSVIVKSFLDQLVRLANSHTMDRTIQRPLTSILSSIIFEGVHKVDVIQSGIFKFLIETFTLSRDLSDQKVLVNIILHTMKNSPKPQLACDEFVQRSGILPLVSLLSTSNDRDTLLRCTQLIVLLTDDEKTREHVLDAGGIHVLASVLETNSQEIQSYCSVALGHLCMIDEETSETVMDSLQHINSSILQHLSGSVMYEQQFETCISLLAILCRLLTQDVFKLKYLQCHELIGSLRKAIDSHPRPEIVELCSTLICQLQS